MLASVPAVDLSETGINRNRATLRVPNVAQCLANRTAGTLILVPRSFAAFEIQHREAVDHADTRIKLLKETSHDNRRALNNIDHKTEHGRQALAKLL